MQAEEREKETQFEVEYPLKLQPLFFEDSSDEEYKLPFNQPADLMANFTILEEGNLGLIQQWQESEQQTEIKRKEYEAIREEKEERIRILDSSVNENRTRAKKIDLEKNKLEMKGAKGNENLMSDQMLAVVVSNISEIRQLIDRKRAKGTNLPDPTSQLVEIETHINKILKFLHMAKEADP